MASLPAPLPEEPPRRTEQTEIDMACRAFFQVKPGLEAVHGRDTVRSRGACRSRLGAGLPFEACHRVGLRTLCTSTGLADAGTEAE